MAAKRKRIPPRPDDSRLLSNLGADLRFMRVGRGWTQDQLAERAGVDQSYITSIERGLMNVRFRLLMKLADAFGITVGKLCAGVDDGSKIREWQAPKKRKKTAVTRRRR